MSEDFKPIRITLSDEAFDELDKIMKIAKFRSYSSTIEECIRAIDDIRREMVFVMGGKKDSTIKITEKRMLESFLRINVRMGRFTGWRIRITEK